MVLLIWCLFLWTPSVIAWHLDLSSIRAPRPSYNSLLVICHKPEGTFANCFESWISILLEVIQVIFNHSLMLIAGRLLCKEVHVMPLVERNGILAPSPSSSCNLAVDLFFIVIILLIILLKPFKFPTEADMWPQQDMDHLCSWPFEVVVSYKQKYI